VNEDGERNWIGKSLSHAGSRCMFDNVVLDRLRSGKKKDCCTVSSFVFEQPSIGFRILGGLNLGNLPWNKTSHQNVGGVLWLQRERTIHRTTPLEHLLDEIEYFHPLVIVSDNVDIPRNENRVMDLAHTVIRVDHTVHPFSLGPQREHSLKHKVDKGPRVYHRHPCFPAFDLCVSGLTLTLQDEELAKIFVHKEAKSLPDQ